MSDLSEIFLPVQRIIPFSNVEGSGNRTSIFLQGCNINCLYCHNPETIPLTSPSARFFSLAELMETIRGSMPFIRGITVSGGEPTIYAKELAVLFRAVHRLGLTCYIDSNGFFDYEAIWPLIEETDRFLFDVKGTGEGLAALCFTRSHARSGADEGKAAEQRKRLSQSGELPAEGAESCPPLSERPEAAKLGGQPNNKEVGESGFTHSHDALVMSGEETAGAGKRRSEALAAKFPPLAERPEAADLTEKAGEVIFARNFENLRRLLPLGKVEEVRLVYIKDFYDEREIVREIAACLKDYPQVLFKLIRVHGKGARKAGEVALHLPKPAEAEDLFGFAGEQGLKNRKLIL